MVGQALGTLGFGNVDVDRRQQNPPRGDSVLGIAEYYVLRRVKPSRTNPIAKSASGDGSETLATVNFHV